MGSDTGKGGAGFFAAKIATVRGFFAALPRVIKYQIITKFLFSLVLVPLFWAASGVLMRLHGTGAVSNGQLLKFVLSPQGVVFSLLGAAVLIAGIIFELCGFIYISAQVIHGQPESGYPQLVKANAALFPKMLGLGGIMILLYAAILVPMTGVGVKISFFEHVKIPNFITSVIEGNVLYASLYVTALLLMLIVSLRWLFTFHFMVIGDLPVRASMRASAKLVSRNIKALMKGFFVMTPIALVAAGLVFFVWAFLIVLLSSVLNLNASASRVFMTFLLLLQEAGIACLALLFIPFEVFSFTELFYGFVKKDPDYASMAEKYPVIAGKTKDSLLDRVLRRRKTLILLAVALLIAVAIPAGIFFRELMGTSRRIEVMAHRGGGSSAPENSLSGIRSAMTKGADWVELDLQRTKDGVYVFMHDDGFSRVAGVSENLADLTYDEVRKIDIGKKFDTAYEGERVPNLEEVLDLCKDKIKVNIELKGKSADRAMADYAVAALRAKRMENQVILTSLEYPLIEYIETAYPDMSTGFIYFLAFGDITTLKADYLILEEGEARSGTLATIHGAGKKAVVWTVNTQNSIEKLASMDIDAVITDELDMVIAAIAARKSLTEKDLLLSAFFDPSND